MEINGPYKRPSSTKAKQLLKTTVVNVKLPFSYI